MHSKTRCITSNRDTDQRNIREKMFGFLLEDSNWYFEVFTFS